MNAVATPAPVCKEKANPPVVEATPVTVAAAVPAAQPEEAASLRDWVAVLFWLVGAAILILMHFTDLIELLFRR